MNKKRIIWIALLPMIFSSACSTDQKNPNPETQETEEDDGKLKEFSKAKLESKTFDYDGQVHSLEVTGAPEGTTIKYTNNDQIKVGRYKVSAKLSKKGYTTRTLTAYLTIEEHLEHFEGLSFSSKTYNYDGEVHSLVLNGAPEGATVRYTNNDKKDVGVYSVTATVSKEGYATESLTATLTIKGKTITGVTFSDKKVKYDGRSHSIYVDNLPEGASVTYSGNGKIQKGTYTVTATITMPGYEPLVLTAKLIITDLSSFPNFVSQDFYWMYDGQYINTKICFENYEDTLSYDRINFDVKYYINGVLKSEPKIKNVGDYTISATYSAEGYESKTCSFKATISDSVGGVDPNKTAFQFTLNTKFKDFYNEIKKGNYSVHVDCWDEYDYDFDGIFEDVREIDNVSNYYVTPEAFAGRHNEGTMDIYPVDYYITKGTKYAFNNKSEYYNNYKYKFPANDYLETVTEISSGMVPFAYLKESATGGFENSVYGYYDDIYGSFEFDLVNNRFIVIGRTKYYHAPNWNHDFVAKYTFYNIGNTKVSIPESYKVKDSQAASYELYSFVRNGIEYNIFDDSVTAWVDIDQLDDAFLGGGGTYVLEPEIDGFPIKQIDYNVHYTYYHVDSSKYDLNVYYDNEGYYQGEYASAGFVRYYKDASKFGNIHYYGEWKQ